MLKGIVSAPVSADAGSVSRGYGVSYPVEGDVELCQEMCDRCSQRSDELRQAATLHRAVVLQVLSAAICCAVNMTL